MLYVNTLHITQTFSIFPYWNFFKASISNDWFVSETFYNYINYCRNTGDTHQAANITVDLMQSITIKKPLEHSVSDQIVEHPLTHTELGDELGVSAFSSEPIDRESEAIETTSLNSSSGKVITNQVFHAKNCKIEIFFVYWAFSFYTNSTLNCINLLLKNCLQVFYQHVGTLSCFG